MRKIIKDRQIVEDRWHYIDDEHALPHEGAVIVSWNRWLQERGDLIARKLELGVRVCGNVDPATVAADCRHFCVIALEFPQLKDGRCYSHARLLRERYGYAGELRAVGEVLRDQMFYMHRVGINAFELPLGRDAQSALSAFDDFSLSYQAAVDHRQPVWRRREAARAV
jgi:uncharacterized protein (DUF934 family)